MTEERAALGLRVCACIGCGAPHHRTGKVALARWYLATAANPRVEVCGTCGNRRTTHPTRSEYLTPIEGLGGTRLRLVGKVVAGQPITSVPVEDEVVCECYDRDCACSGKCRRTALYQWGDSDTSADLEELLAQGEEHGDWLYLCRTCCLRLVKRGVVPDFEEEEAKEDTNAD